MLFRPLELALSLRYQLGFTIGSFTFDDGTFRTFLGCIWDRESQSLYLSFLFVGWLVGAEEDDDDIY